MRRAQGSSEVQCMAGHIRTSSSAAISFRPVLMCWLHRFTLDYASEKDSQAIYTTGRVRQGRIIGLREGGWSYRRIAQHVGYTDVTVARCWQQWIQQGTYQRQPGSGRPRQTGLREDRRLVRHARNDPTATVADIQRAVGPSLNQPTSGRTICRRLRDVGLRSRRPLRRLPLTALHRRQRLEWCRARRTWGVEWHRVVFTDESRFCLGGDDNRIRVWRQRGQRQDARFVVQRHTSTRPGVMVWGAIAYDAKSPLVFVTGSLTGQRYVQEILQPVAIPFLNSQVQPLFQQDNARPHIAAVSRACLQGVDTIPWPAFSPDLSPIENVWDAMGRDVTTPPVPRNLQELHHRVQAAWDGLSQDFIKNLYDSLPRRLACCIKNNGGHTPY